MRIKPNCKICSRPYLGGGKDTCKSCLAYGPPRRKLKRLQCLCGKVARVVAIAEVLSPEDDLLEVEIPLCRDCEQLEMILEAAETRIRAKSWDNPIQVIVVKSLPRPSRPLRGRRFGS